MKPALWQCQMADGTIQHLSGIFSEPAEINGVEIRTLTPLYLNNAHADLVSLAKQLIDRVEFDVNGVQGKGGNGGLTSDDTIRAAGEMRILLSKLSKEN